MICLIVVTLCIVLGPGITSFSTPSISSKHHTVMVSEQADLERSQYFNQVDQPGRPGEPFL